MSYYFTSTTCFGLNTSIIHPFNLIVLLQLYFKLCELCFMKYH
jgi:hypothetical protein